MPPTKPIRRMVGALLLGIGVGLFSSRADLLPADTWLHVVVVMGNAIGPWVAVAFAAGAIQGEPRRGAVGGAIALCAGVATYYGAALLTWGDRAPAFLVQLAVLWLLVAALSGGALGAAGGGWANGRYRLGGPIVLGGALLAEAAYQFVQVEGWRGLDITRTGFQIAAIDTVAALLATPVLVERGRRAQAYLASVALGLVGFALLAAIEALISAVLYALPA